METYMLHVLLLVLIENAMIIEICMVISAFIQLSTYIYQVQYNKQKKSIYGLSYDYIVLSWVYYLASTVTTINYCMNPVIIKQYRARFPVYPSIFVSIPILIIDILGLIMSTGILIQLFYIYSRTRNIDQCVSGLNKLYLVSITLVLFWISKCCILNQSTLSTLDVVDFLWFFAKLTECLKLLPQVTMNWFGSCVIGLHSRFLLCQWLSIIFLALAKFMLHNANVPYFEVLVNYNTWCYLMINSSTLSLLTIQQKKLYKGAAPSLRLKYIESKNDNEIA